MKKFLCLTLALLLAGCNKPSDQQIDAGIDIGVPVSVQAILKRVAKKPTDTTKKDIALIENILKNTAIPFVQNGALPAMQLLPQLDDMVLSKLPPDYETGLVAILGLAAANVDLKAPKMSDAEKQHILHALNGIVAGCDLYLNGLTAQLYGPPVRAVASAPDIVIEGNAAEVVELADADSGMLFPPPADAIPAPVSSSHYSLICCVENGCGACKRQEAIFEAHPEQIPGFDHVSIVNIEEQPAIRKALEVKGKIWSVPCMVVMYDDKWEGSRHYGVFSCETIASWLKTKPNTDCACQSINPVQPKVKASGSNREGHPGHARHWESDDGHGQGHWVWD